MDKNELITKIEHAREVLRAQKEKYYSTHFYEFNRDVLGWPDIYEPLHKRVCDFVQDNVDKKKLLMLLPRGSFKSSIITVGYTLWRICKNPNERVLIANATYPMAVSFLKQIKDHLSKNETLKEIYGDLTKDAEGWRENLITLAGTMDGTGYRGKEPTVSAYGMESNLTGSHFTFGIMDDMVNRDNINTREQLDKPINFFKDALDLIDPINGRKQILVIGTTWHQCLHKDSLINIGGDGVAVLDLVSYNYSGNVMTHKGREKQVLQVGKRKANNMVSIGVYGDPYRIMTTEEHLLFTADGWKKAVDIKPKDYLLYPISNKSIFPKLELPVKDEDFWWLVGYWLAEGNLDRTWGDKKTRVCLTSSAESDSINNAIRIIKKFWRQPEIQKRAFNTWCVRHSNRTLAEFLAMFGDTSKKKFIPSFVEDLPKEYIIRLILGYWEGDGSKSKIGYRFSSSSYNLLCGVRRLLWKIGIFPQIYGTKSNGKIQTNWKNTRSEGKEYKISDRFELRVRNKDWYKLGFEKHDGRDRGSYGKVDDRYAYTCVKEVSTFKEEQDVFNLMVGEDESFAGHNVVYHNSDLYSWIEDEESGVGQDFAVLKLPAYEGEWGKGKLLFPTRLGWEQLEELKRSQGSSHFAAQYMLNPVPREDALFKFDFKYYDETDLTGLDLNKFFAIDPALSDKKSADYSAMVCVGVDKNNTWYILDIWRDKVNPSRLIDQVFYWDEKWKPVTIGMETVAFQKILQFSINDEMRKRNRFIPIKELTHHDKSKDERIRGLEPRYETGTIFHNKAVKETMDLEDELRRFPRGKNDDLIDALASILEISYPPRKRMERRTYRKTDYPA